MPEVERLSHVVNTTAMALQNATDKVAGYQSHLSQRQAHRATIQQRLDTATQRWEGIRKQIEELAARVS
jgi:phage shock protein A